MKKEDDSLENLLELNGIKYVIDENLGLWVKFEVKRVQRTNERPYGIRYSLTLHDRFNKRIMGFDNAHSVEDENRINKDLKRAYDHFHRDEYDKGKLYKYENAGKLLEDFWKEVDKICKRLGA